MTNHTIPAFDDVIDSRDIIERLEELESERECLVSTYNECREAAERCVDDVGYRQDMMDASKALADWMDDYAHELEALKALADEAADYAEDWEYGVTLIRDSYFKDYVMELAEYIGAINANATWPNDCIDWAMAARELQMDYTAVEFDGVTYWVR